jgi:hypothetical protein
MLGSELDDQSRNVLELAKAIPFRPVFRTPGCSPGGSFGRGRP